MQKRPLDTELEVLRAEHLEDDVFSVRAYNVLVRRLGLHTLGDILNLTCDDIAKARGAGKKTIEEIAGLVQSCGYELNGFAKASPDSKQQKQISFLGRAHQHFSNWQANSTARTITPKIAPMYSPAGFPERQAGTS